MITQRFQEEGCPNCADVLDIGLATTSPTFEGLVAIGEPEKSWVAKWLRVNTYIPGLYAVKVQGRLPPDIAESLPYYRPRDGTATD
ncbi:CYFA0S01e04588g1_1 [Cyberlindnera fabianii]|uniref:Transcription elongation factor SPT4 n=1 Tax=Cyberlindnera fabianii TaxID=36022 RepID=A0A061APZ8_CYBFA|nr:CYFA0S01e04588g1_1 [Cyberlindnera fabianii]